MGSADVIRCSSAPNALHSAFGDHDCLKGCLSEDGAVLGFEPGSDELEHLLPPEVRVEHPKFSFVTIAGSGRVAAILKPPRPGPETVSHVVEFASLDDFISWYIDPAREEGRPAAHHILPTLAVQLVAGATFFAVITLDGQVLTWSADTRYPRALGRTPNAEHLAIEPSPVIALSDIKITKISACAGGWITAAISENRDLYLWGADGPSATGIPESSRRLRMEGLPAEGEDVSLVNVGAGADGVGVDIMDVAVGSSHVIVLDDSGKIWTAGENNNGQLGLVDVVHEFAGTFRSVSCLGGKGEKVWAADKGSMVLVEEDEEEKEGQR